MATVLNGLIIIFAKGRNQNFHREERFFCFISKDGHTFITNHALGGGATYLFHLISLLSTFIVLKYKVFLQKLF